MNMIVLTIVTTLSITFLYSIQSMYLTQNKFKVESWKKEVAFQMAQSAAIPMEAALKRRLYEAPPRSTVDCHKADDVKMDEVGTNYEYHVLAHFDHKNSVITLTSEAKVSTYTAKIVKIIRISDVSDYLLYSSDSDSEISINHAGGPTNVTSLAAGKRQIYTKGNLTLSNMYSRVSYDHGGLPTSVKDADFGILIQAERLTAQKGIAYKKQSWKNLREVLDDLRPTKKSVVPAEFKTITDLDGMKNYYGQQAMGNAVFLNNKTDLNTIETKIRNSTSLAPAELNLAIQNSYPISYKCDGNSNTSNVKPMMLDSAGSACYINNPQYELHYSYHDKDSADMIANVTCVSSSNTSCSDSNAYPASFKRWKTDSSLSNTVYTSDGPNVSLSKIDWDVLESLEDDAKTCGMTVDANTTILPDIESCDLTHLPAQMLYATGGASTAVCTKVKYLDLDRRLTLNVFDQNDYDDVAIDKAPMIRRVVYAKVPLKIDQQMQSGIGTQASSLLNSVQVRKNLSLWIVDVNQITLGLKRENNTPGSATNKPKYYFNQAYDASGTLPVKMVLLSPDQVKVEPEGFTELSFAKLNQMLPYTGKLMANYHLYTDRDQENLGFKYGAGQVYINNIAIITNPIVDKYKNMNDWYKNGIYLRGLWSNDWDYTFMHARDLCMLSGVTGIPVPVTTDPSVYPLFPPPPLTPPLADLLPYRDLINNDIKKQLPNDTSLNVASRFYKRPPAGGPGNPFTANSFVFPVFGRPQVFYDQAGSEPSTIRSEIYFKGIRIFADFDSDNSPTGSGRTLPLKAAYPAAFLIDQVGFGGDVVVDMSDKKWNWSFAGIFTNVSGNAQCNRNNITEFGTGNSYIPGWTSSPYPGVLFNAGAAIFNQDDPDETTFSKLGGLHGNDLPSVQVRER